MVISVFGKDGSGKTTIATHLAKVLSDKNKFVGIVSLEMRYGSIQRSLGINISEDKSIINALTQSDIRNYATRYTDNIYVFSLSDTDDITKYDALQNIAKDENILLGFLKKLNESFDYVVVDLTEMVIDSLTYFMIKNSDKLINVFESRAEQISFAQSHNHILHSLTGENNIINVLNKHDEAIINKSTIKDICDFDITIDFNTDIIKDERQCKLNKYLLKQVNEITQLVENKNVNNNKKSNVFLKILGRR